MAAALVVGASSVAAVAGADSGGSAAVEADLAAIEDRIEARSAMYALLAEAAEEDAEAIARIRQFFASSTTTTTTTAPTSTSTTGDTTPPTRPPGPESGIWLDADEIAALPTTGEAWEQIVSEADQLDPTDADIADNSNEHDTRTLAAALYAARTGNERERVVEALEDAVGTEEGDSVLSLGRALQSYVIAADLIQHRSERFVEWVDEVRTRTLDGRTLISVHEERPNNWGTHAGASRIAAALYLGDGVDLARAALVFRGWLGERGVYDGFEYAGDGDLSWQADPENPVGINPAGATIDGHDVDGVLPDDQRRAGSFRWPPKCENYAWEALQGAVVSAHLLDRIGVPAWEWSDGAIGRAISWLHRHDCAATGDDTWILALVNDALGTDYPSGLGIGKGIGYAAWSHG